MEYYRIEIVDSTPLECSEWEEIPSSGIITINRSDFSSNQYVHGIRIVYGLYDAQLGVIVSDKYEYADIFNSNCTRELVDEYNEYRLRILEGVKEILKENDSDFDKVKKPMIMLSIM